MKLLIFILTIFYYFHDVELRHQSGVTRIQCGHEEKRVYGKFLRFTDGFESGDEITLQLKYRKMDKKLDDSPFVDLYDSFNSRSPRIALRVKYDVMNNSVILKSYDNFRWHNPSAHKMKLKRGQMVVLKVEKHPTYFSVFINGKLVENYENMFKENPVIGINTQNVNVLSAKLTCNGVWPEIEKLHIEDVSGEIQKNPNSKQGGNSPSRPNSRSGGESSSNPNGRSGGRGNGNNGRANIGEGKSLANHNEDSGGRGNKNNGTDGGPGGKTSNTGGRNGNFNYGASGRTGKKSPSSNPNGGSRGNNPSHSKKEPGGRSNRNNTTASSSEGKTPSNQEGGSGKKNPSNPDILFGINGTSSSSPGQSPSSNHTRGPAGKSPFNSSEKSEERGIKNLYNGTTSSSGEKKPSNHKGGLTERDNHNNGTTGGPEIIFNPNRRSGGRGIGNFSNGTANSSQGKSPSNHKRGSGVKNPSDPNVGRGGQGIVNNGTTSIFGKKSPSNNKGVPAGKSPFGELGGRNETFNNRTTSSSGEKKPSNLNVGPGGRGIGNNGTDNSSQGKSPSNHTGATSNFVGNNPSNHKVGLSEQGNRNNGTAEGPEVIFKPNRRSEERGIGNFSNGTTISSQVKTPSNHKRGSVVNNPSNPDVGPGGQRIGNNGTTFGGNNPSNHKGSLTERFNQNNETTGGPEVIFKPNRRSEGRRIGNFNNGTGGKNPFDPDVASGGPGIGNNGTANRSQGNSPSSNHTRDPAERGIGNLNNGTTRSSGENNRSNHKGGLTERFNRNNGTAEGQEVKLIFKPNGKPKERGIGNNGTSSSSRGKSPSNQKGVPAGKSPFNSNGKSGDNGTTINSDEKNPSNANGKLREPGIGNKGTANSSRGKYSAEQDNRTNGTAGGPEVKLIFKPNRKPREQRIGNNGTTSKEQNPSNHKAGPEERGNRYSEGPEGFSPSNRSGGSSRADANSNTHGEADSNEKLGTGGASSRNGVVSFVGHGTNAKQSGGSQKIDSSPEKIALPSYGEDESGTIIIIDNTKDAF